MLHVLVLQIITYLTLHKYFIHEMKIAQLQQRPCNRPLRRHPICMTFATPAPPLPVIFTAYLCSLLCRYMHFGAVWSTIKIASQLVPIGYLMQEKLQKGAA